MKTPDSSELTPVKGGAFLLSEPGDAPIFVPEGFSETHRDFYEAVRAFMTGSVTPNNERIETGDPAYNRELLVESCEMGMASVEVAEPVHSRAARQACIAWLRDSVSSRTSSSGTRVERS